MGTLSGPLDRAHAAEFRRSWRHMHPTMCPERCHARELDKNIVVEDRKPILETYYRVSEGRQHT